MKIIKQKIPLAGWYGFADQEFECYASASSTGITVSVEVPDSPTNELFNPKFIQIKELTWAEVDADESAIRNAALDMAKNMQELNEAREGVH